MNTSTNGMTAELPTMKAIKPKAKSAKAKPTNKPKTPAKSKTIEDLPSMEALQNEEKLNNEIIWYDLPRLKNKGLRKNRYTF